MNEEVQKKYMELQMLQMQLQQVQKQMQALEQQAEEMDTVTEALDDLNGSDSGSEMFVTVTPGVFVKAKLEETQKVLLNVGGGAIVEKPIPDAKKLVGDQGDELRKMHSELAEQVQKMVARAEKVQEELRKLVE